MTDYHDGIYEAARRNYRDCPRSFHIPEPVNEYSRPSFVVFVAALLVACAIVAGMVL